MAFDSFAAQRDPQDIQTVYVHWTYTGAATEFRLDAGGNIYTLTPDVNEYWVTVSRWIATDCTITEIDSNDSAGPIAIPALPPILSAPVLIAANRTESGEIDLTIDLPRFITHPTE